MVDMSFQDIVQVVNQLTHEQKKSLIAHLQADAFDENLTREQAVAELEWRRAAGLFAQVESLMDKYARPNVDISDDDLNVYLKDIGTDWEADLDDLIK